ncbi:MAG: DUF1573 domain-containing protein [Flavobacteriaceae bacterium]|nr:DUF1573 domain-containing protein [Flavobacteriaceae bacterium]
MKKIIVVGILSLSLFTMSCKEDASSKINQTNLETAKERDSKIKSGGAKFNFDKIEHDFGVINEGDIVETVFKFTNSGKSELIITSAKATCGCTVPEWPKEPIMPGESGEIKVKFNSSRKPNLQQKQITLVTNTSNGKEILKIKAQVTPSSKS